MKNVQYSVPDYLLSEDIKRVRRKLNMSQSEFAQLVKASKPTVERWESSKNKITGPIVFLVNMLDENMDYVDENDEQISIYPIEIRKRVRDVIFEQMRKYPYLFE